MDELQSKNYYAMFSDVWRFFRKHFKPKNNTEWDALMEAAGKLHKEYNSKLCEDLLLCVLDEIQRISKA